MIIFVYFIIYHFIDNIIQFRIVIIMVLSSINKKLYLYLVIIYKLTDNIIQFSIKVYKITFAIIK